MKNNANSAKVDLNTFRLTPMGRFWYALGDFGYNFMYYWINTYMVIYFTDTMGIKAGMVSVMLLAIRLFDALNDPIIGSMADRTRSRWGRYRPWYMAGSIVMSILIVVIFACNPNWEYNTRVIYMWIAYTAMTVASTCSNMPYTALGGCITANSEDRAKVSSLRMMLTNIASMLILIIAIPMIRTFSTGGEIGASGYFYAVLISCAIGCPLMVASCWNVKEVVTPPETQVKIPLNLQMRSMLRNKPAILLFIAQFCFAGINYGKPAILIYYWQYNVGDAGLATTYGIINLVAAVVGCGWLGPWLHRRMRHKGKVNMLLNLIVAVTHGLMFFFPAPSIIFWVLSFIGWLAFCAYLGIHFGCIGDIVDYGEYVSGVRCDGFLNAFLSIAQKAGAAIVPAISLAVLSAIHYVPNMQQTSEVLTAINCMTTLVPAAFGLLNVFIFMMYPISDDKQQEVLDELIRRRENAAAVVK